MSLWLVLPIPERLKGKTWKWRERINISHEPCRTILTVGLGMGENYWIEDDGQDPPPKMKSSRTKPAYQVPLMAEIAKIPWNGLTVASTFSGCGGSCTGYRMAGFKVVWANEFVPSAQASYKANAAADCTLDPRDIKIIHPKEILKATGLKVGELDLFDGSPPCQAFSTAGKREKGWGQAKTYEHGAKQCNETLFDQYIRLLRGLKPKVFVAENVAGLIKGTAKGYFLEILAALKASGYRVSCRVLDAQWLGVPQQRQRTIFIGVREDLNIEPVHPKPLSYRYSVRDALPWIEKAIHDTGGNFSQGNVTNKAEPCVMAGRMDFKIEGANGYNGHAAKSVNRPMPTVQARRPVKIEMIVGNDAFESVWGGTDQPHPTVTTAPNKQGGFIRIEPEADISRYAIGKEWDKLKPGEQSSKYFSLVKPSPDFPCPTMTAKDPTGKTAQVCHPTEKRKFTIAELKRICAFPDDFILCGSYAQQWERLGNSVPPVMMFHIASTIRDSILIGRASSASP